MSRHRSVGATSAWWDGTDLVIAAEGVLEHDKPAPVSATTMYAVGSVTKLITAFMILQLVDEGMLTLDDLVIEHIPEFLYRDSDIAGRVTIRHLLTHSGGTPDGWFPADSTSDVLATLAESPALCEPGWVASYSNSGYALLGEILTRRTGRKFAQNLAQRLLVPLGLEHTLILPPDLRALRGAPDHRADPNSGEIRREDMWLRVGDGMEAAGSTLYASAPDLALIAVAMSTGVNPRDPGGARMLSEELTADATRRHAEVPGIGLITSAFGLGWLHPRQPDDRRVVSHGGGTSIVVFVDLDSGDVVVTATNFDQGEQVGGDVARALIGAPSASPSPTAPASPVEHLVRLTGRWGVGPLANTIRLDGDHLVMEVMGETAQLVEVDPTSFLLTVSGLHLDLALMHGDARAADWIHFAGRALARQT